jgi:hypothetical protein
MNNNVITSLTNFRPDILMDRIDEEAQEFMAGGAKIEDLVFEWRLINVNDSNGQNFNRETPKITCGSP